jgi:hypothetical protein
MTREASVTESYGPVTVTVVYRPPRRPDVYVVGDRGGVCPADKELAAARVRYWCGWCLEMHDRTFDLLWR